MLSDVADSHKPGHAGLHSAANTAACSACALQIAELERRAAEDDNMFLQPKLTSVSAPAAEPDEPLLDRRGDMANLQFESLYQPPARRTWDPQYLKAAAREALTINSIR